MRISKILLVAASPFLLAPQAGLAQSAHPACSSQSSDADGDGFGWENQATCVVTLDSSASQPPATTCIDTDGDGWGWDGTQSCLVTGPVPTDTSPTDTSPTDTMNDSAVDDVACIDTDGDGWGWQQLTASTGRSCQVTMDPVASVDDSMRPDSMPPLDDSSLPDSFSLLPAMVSIDAGCFDIGSPADELRRSADEGPQTNVCIEALDVSIFEVTFTQYDAYATATGQSLPDDQGFGRGNRPVINVDWNDATSYATWLSSQTGENYRLPTEAEWEYFTRAGTTTPFNTGQTLTIDQANFNGSQSYNGSPVGSASVQTLPVGSFAPNDFGLYNTHGNAMEWTCSSFVGDYRSISTPLECDDSNTVPHVLRGGSWGGIAQINRSAWRNNLPVNFTSEFIGFRVVRQ